MLGRSKVIRVLGNLIKVLDQAKIVFGRLIDPEFLLPITVDPDQILFSLKAKSVGHFTIRSWRLPIFHPECGWKNPSVLPYQV